jgi:hypothetical protein
MKLAVEIDIRKTGDGFEVVNAGLINIDKNARAAKQSTDDMGSALAKAGVGAGIAFLTKQAIDLGDELQTASQRTQMSVETLSALRLAAREAGTSLEKVTSTAEGLQNQAVEAASGNRQLAAVFGVVGIKAKELKTLGPDELLERVAKGFHNIHDPAVRAAVSTQLMRDRAGELTPFLDELGEKGLKGVTDHAKEMGAVMSGEAAEAANKLNSRIAVLRQQTSVALVGIAQSVNVLAEAFGDDLPKGLTASLNPFNLVTEAVRGLSGLVILIIEQIKIFTGSLGAMLEGIPHLASGIIDNMAAVYQTLNKPDFHMSDWKTVFDQIKKLGHDVSGEYANIRKNVNDEVERENKIMADRLEKNFKGSKFAIGGAFDYADPTKKKPEVDPRLRAIVGRADDTEARRLQAYEQLKTTIDQITQKQDKEIEKARLLEQITSLDVAATQERGQSEAFLQNQYLKHVDVLEAQLDLIHKIADIERERVRLNAEIKQADEDARHTGAGTQLDQMLKRIAFERQQFVTTNGRMGLTEEEAAREQRRINEARFEEDVLYQAKTNGITADAAAARLKIDIGEANDANAKILEIADERNKKLLGLYADINAAALNAMQTGIEDIFSGHGLKNAIDGFAGALRQALAKALLTGMDEWLDKLRRTAVSGSTEKTMLGGRLSQRDAAGLAYGALQGGAAVYGLYQNAQNGASRGANAVAGAAQGAALFSAAGPYGAAVGAVLGAAYGAVLSKIAEGAQARYQVAVGADGRLTVQGFGKAGQSDVDAAVRALNQTLDETMQSVRSIIDAFPKAIQQQIQQGAADLFQPGDILSGDAVHKVRTFIISIRKKSLAGGFTSDELKHFNEVELPGLVYDAYAPLFEAGLKNMGVTEDKLKELFAKLPGFDPKEQLQRIQDFVTVMTGFMDSDAFNKLSGSELMGKASSTVGATPMDQILKFASDIKDLATGFADLTTDEQLQRGKQIIDLEKQRQQAVLQYLYEIKQAQDAAFKSIEQQRTEIGMAALGPFAQRSALQGQLTGVLGNIGNAKTPQELSQLGSDAQALIGRIYDLSVSIPADLNNMIDAFGKLNDVLSPDKSPAEQLVDLAGKMAAASDKMRTATGTDDQVAAARELLGYAQERYQLERQMMQEINATIKEINDSIDQTIHDFQLQAKITALGPNANPQDVANLQIDDLMQRQRTLRDQLGTASSAQDINRIVGEMNSNAQQLFDLMGKTPEAAAQLTKMLEDVRKQADERLKKLADDIQKDDEIIRGEIKDAVGTLKAALATLPDAANAAQKALDDLQARLGARFDFLTEEVVAANTELLGTVGNILDILRSGLEGIFGPQSGAGGGAGTTRPGFNDGPNFTPGANSYNAPGSTESGMAIVVNVGTPEVSVSLAGTAERLIETVQATAAMKGARMAVTALQQQLARRSAM